MGSESPRIGGSVLGPWGLKVTALLLSLVGALSLLPTPVLAEAGRTAWVNGFIVNVYEKPDAQSKQLDHLLKGEEVDIKGQSGEWSKLVVFNGLLVGWVATKDLRFVRPGKRFRRERVETRDYGDLVSPTYPGKQLMARAKAATGQHSGAYRGSDYCLGCHKPGVPNVPGGGKPKAIWENSYHARAYKTLLTGKARAVGRRYGIASPHLDGRCLKCHVTGYGAPNGEAAAIKKSEGVGCEVCHGPGNTSLGSNSPYDIRDMARREQVCTGCHNELSPTWNGFSLGVFSKAIAHWTPRNKALKAHAKGKAVALRKTMPQAAIVTPPPAPPAPPVVKRPPAKPPVKPDQGGGGSPVIVLHDGGFFPVKFPHKKHQTEYDLSCTTCHHVPGQFKCRACHSKKSKVSRKKAFHMAGNQSCQKCHRNGRKDGWNGPITCAGCHKK